MISQTNTYKDLEYAPVPGEWPGTPQDPYGVQAMCKEGMSTKPRALRFTTTCEMETKLIREYMKQYPQVILSIRKLY